MSYVIESYRNSLKSTNLVESQQIQEQIAAKFGSSMQYFTHEVEGYKRLTKRSDNIHVAHFNDIAFDNLLNYIRETIHTSNYKIDCVYTDDITFDMLYASPKYLKRLDKNMAISVKKLLQKNTIEMKGIKNIICNK